MKNKAFIYVMQKEENLCKIGLSKCPESRKDHLQSMLKSKLKINGYYSSENCFFDEKRIHEILSEFRLGGEFFSLSYALIKDRLKGIYEFCDYIPEQLPEKVKCTFYIPKTNQDYFDDLYHKLNIKGPKITRSELMIKAIDTLKTLYPGVVHGQ